VVPAARMQQHSSIAEPLVRVEPGAGQGMPRYAFKTGADLLALTRKHNVRALRTFGTACCDAARENGRGRGGAGALAWFCVRACGCVPSRIPTRLRMGTGCAHEMRPLRMDGAPRLVYFHVHTLPSRRGLLDACTEHPRNQGTSETVCINVLGIGCIHVLRTRRPTREQSAHTPRARGRMEMNDDRAQASFLCRPRFRRRI
jgi:hypothetical protein